MEYNGSMQVGKLKGKARIGTRPQRRAGQWVGNAFLAVGALLVAMAALYGAYAVLTNWLIGQDRYLLDGGVARLSLPAPTLTPSPTPTATPHRHSRRRPRRHLSRHCRRRRCRSRSRPSASSDRSLPCRV